MLPQLKLTMTQNGRVIHTITKTVEKQHLIKSLEEFQLEANAALTTLIEDLGEIDETIGDANLDEVEDDEDTDDDDNCSQSTGKESNEDSESKKKKYN